MPLWFIVLVFSVFLTLMTSLYLSRQNGRNGHRNGSNHKAPHEISSFLEKEEKQTTPFPFKKQIKQFLIRPGETKEPNIKNVSPFQKEKEEAPHDHQDPSQHQPDPALRERRRPLRDPREDEAEEGEDETDDRLSPPESSVAPDAIPEPMKMIGIERGALEEWRQDEDFQDRVITRKDAEVQTEARMSWQEDKSLQESQKQVSIGIGTDNKELRHQSLQISPPLQDKSIQKNISPISVGIQHFNIFREDKSIQAEEEEINFSLSSLPKLKQFFFSEEEKFDFSKSLILSLSGRASKNFLDDIQTVKSEILLSPKSNRSIQEDEIEESFFHPIIQKKKSFRIEDIPLEVSIYPSFNKSLVESEVIENSILEKSRSLSLKNPKPQKDFEDISFEVLDKPIKSVKKKFIDDLSFEVIEKSSKKSSFIILSDEDKNN